VNSFQHDIKLQPLRIPANWCIGWNTLFEVNPTEDNIKAGLFGGSSKFQAVNVELRLLVDVAWTPEDDVNGNFYLYVEYAPWERNEKGRRIKVKELSFSDSKTVHEFTTRDRIEIVSELEKVLIGNSEWIEHS